MPRVTDPDFTARVGAAIVARRKWLEIGQAELARRLGITAGQMSKYELGLNTPDALFLVRLSTALGMTPNDLLDHQGTPQGARSHLSELSALLGDVDISGVVAAMKGMDGADRRRVRMLVAAYHRGTAA
jgi:transcriptional regulator with XRE-family HTH domain